MTIKLMSMILAFGILFSACQSTDPMRTVEIHDIQGCGHISPMVDRQVWDVQGIVTRKMDNGFVMQSSTTDGKTCSSEAIFVHTGNYPKVVSGDVVVVKGRVAEFTPGNSDQKNLSQTEITDASVQRIESGQTFPPATLLGADGYPFPKGIIEDDMMSDFDPESDGLDYYESLEWMRVELPEMIAVGPRNSYNEIVAAEYQAGDAVQTRASAALVETTQDLHPERLMVDLPGNWTRKINMGDLIESGAIGILTYSYGNFKVDPVTNVKLVKYPGITEKSEELNLSELRIAIYNLNNFSQYSAPTKRDTLGSQIANDLNSPDLLIIQEVMDDSGTADDGTVSAAENLTSLVDAIRQAGGASYQFYNFLPGNNGSGGISGGNIRTVFLLNSQSPLKLKSKIGELGRQIKLETEAVGRIAIEPNPGQFGFDHWEFANSRKPIVGLFEYEGQQVVVIGLHLVSKALDSPYYGSEQPIVQPELEKRMAESRAVNTWVEEVQRISPGAIIVVAGDMNDGYDSDVLRSLQGKSLVDSAERIDPEDRFSLLNDGLAMLFDHILISKNVTIQDVTIFHLNTILDETSQVSDHDPVVISLDLH